MPAFAHTIAPIRAAVPARIATIVIGVHSTSGLHRRGPRAARPQYGGSNGSVSWGSSVVIIQRNYTPSALPKGTDITELTSRVTVPLTMLLEESGLDQDAAAALRIHLDWLQYKTSFRDPVMVRRAVDQHEHPLPLSEISIDLRQLDPPTLSDRLKTAVKALQNGNARALSDPQSAGGPFYLDVFRPWRDSVIWDFNRLFWRRLAEWEAYAHRGFEVKRRAGREPHCCPRRRTHATPTLKADSSL